MDDLLTSVETADILRIRVNTLEVWRMRGKGPVYLKAGDGPSSPIRYRRADVIAWLENRLRTSTSAHSASLALAQRPRTKLPKSAPVPDPNAPWLKKADA